MGWQAFWTDPEFAPARHAFYYVRVLEIPIPRCSTCDAKVRGGNLRVGADVDPGARLHLADLVHAGSGVTGKRRGRQGLIRLGVTVPQLN
jgi:Protein of unknown function (DUF3604)